MKIISAVAAVVLLSCSLCLQTQGGQISGDITFDVGNVTFNDVGGNPTISLANAAQVSSWNNARVTSATGDFATFVTFLDSVTLTAPWIFNPSTMTTPLWTVDGFSFALASATITSQPADGSHLNISGIGTITSTNDSFDPTPGKWTFSIPSAGAGSPFTFISDTATAVPEPSTWVGAALAGCVAVYSQRRRLSRAMMRVG